MRQILIRYDLKISFSKLVKVLVLVLELFYGTRTRVHFSISVLVLVLEVFCGTRTRTRKLSTRLHHCITEHNIVYICRDYNTVSIDIMTQKSKKETISIKRVVKIYVIQQQGGYSTKRPHRIKAGTLYVSNSKRIVEHQKKKMLVFR